MTELVQLPQISYASPNFGDAFMASLHRYGFAAVVDHPLDSERIDRIYADWMDFFADKRAADFAMDPVNQDGYFSLQQAEAAKGFDERDFKEYFQYYPWGRCPDALEPDLAAHFSATVTLGSELLRCIAESLPAEITARFTEPLCDMIEGSGQSMLRVLHYPPVPAGESVLRAAPHEDINLLTLLPAADGPGLELQLRGGEWVSVPHKPGQLIINIGDMLQEVTDGYLPSTTHRVAAPARGEALPSRMSLPLFLHPRPEVVLSSRYSARQYLTQRLNELGVV